MIKAFAPRMPRGCSWVLLAILLVVSLFSPAAAQTQGKAAGKKDAPKASDKNAKKDPPLKSDQKDADNPGEADGAAAAEVAPKKEPAVEIFKDPIAEQILKKKYSSVGRTSTDRTLYKQIQEMAGGGANVEQDKVAQFVQNEASELTKQANVQALIELVPAGNKPNPNALKIRDASERLLEVLERAKKAKNQGFLTTYTKVLLSKDFLPLLNNNLFARIEAIIILGQTGSEAALDVFIAQLKDVNQTTWVKLWAARGITNITEEGTRDLPTGSAVKAAKVLADWLEKEKGLPWPAQMRALEALGSLRQSNDPAKAGQPEFAAIAMKFLADPKARAEVRSTAAWAIGMMRINQAISKFNFSLVAFNVGEVAADLGERIHGAHPENSLLSEYYAGFLLFEVFPALEGKDGARDSGLTHFTHPNMAPARTFIKQQSDLMKPMVKATLDMLRSPSGRAKEAEKDLSDRVAALKLFLEKNAPTDIHLVPGGPPFPVRNPQVAEAPVGK